MSGAPPNVEWDGEPVWGPGVTPNPDGTATLTITDAEQAPTIVVTNTLTKLFGTFGVAKQVDGDFDLDSPELADVTFTVTASWPAGPGTEAGSVDLVLNAGNDCDGAVRGHVAHRHGGDAVRGDTVRHPAGRRLGRHHLVR